VYEEGILFSEARAEATGDAKITLDAANEKDWAKRTVEQMIQGAILRKMQAEVKVFSDMIDVTVEKEYLIEQCSPLTDVDGVRTWDDDIDFVLFRRFCDPYWTGIDKYCKDADGNYDSSKSDESSAEFTTRCEKKALDEKITAAALADTCESEFGLASEWVTLETCRARRLAWLAAQVVPPKKQTCSGRRNCRYIQRVSRI